MDTIRSFLDTHWDQASPLLLGYSGGPDSKALLYALLEAGCSTLHLAHFDHGWRPESQDEQRAVEREAEELRLPLYTGKTDNTNARDENSARQARWKFFEHVYNQAPFQALLLAHHADDQAETVLKRVFEGAQLISCIGMRPWVQKGSMTVWRPLVSTPRLDLVAYLEAKNLCGFDDASNRDPRYLRSRCKSHLIPTLAAHFGKEIDLNLCLLAERCTELKEYLDERIQSIPTTTTERGIQGDLSAAHPLEQKHWLLQQISLPRRLLKIVLTWVKDKECNKEINWQMTCIRVQNGVVFVESPLPTDVPSVMGTKNRTPPFTL
ncbi:MAG: tRNA(Ile)-lysidine synthase [Chlamydiota bacterium]|jgi:tRNA(Ile)-lysidine synthase